MSFKEKFRNFFNTDDEYEYIEEIKVDQDNVAKNKNDQKNIVNLTKIEQATSKVILFEPTSYNEVQDIADSLLNKRSIVINLHKVDRAKAKRIVDFLSGTVYAIKGNIKKLGISTFLCTPENVDVSGQISIDFDEEDEIEKGW